MNEILTRSTKEVKVLPIVISVDGIVHTIKMQHDLEEKVFGNKDLWRLIKAFLLNYCGTWKRKTKNIVYEYNMLCACFYKFAVKDHKLRFTLKHTSTYKRIVKAWIGAVFFRERDDVIHWSHRMLNIYRYHIPSFLHVFFDRTARPINKRPPTGRKRTLKNLFCPTNTLEQGLQSIIEPLLFNIHYGIELENMNNKIYYARVQHGDIRGDLIVWDRPIEVYVKHEYLKLQKQPGWQLFDTIDCAHSIGFGFISTTYNKYYKGVYTRYDCHSNEQCMRVIRVIEL